MDEKKVQDQELKDVNGGYVDLDEEFTISCYDCGARYNKDVAYPNGFYVKNEQTGCGSTTTYYKCPNCGREWHD